MNKEYRTGRVEFNIPADFNARVKHTSKKASSSNQLNIGYFFLQNLIADLKLKDFFHEKTIGRKVTFDCHTIHRLPVHARILDPLPKHAIWHKLDSYYENPDFDFQHILPFMDLSRNNYDNYPSWFYTQSGSVVKRDSSILYYDCTNFYFECKQADEDTIDEGSGEVMKSLRQYGVSKEHRPNPIVETSPFMDKNGIPITMCPHSDPSGSPSAPAQNHDRTAPIPFVHLY